MYRKIKSDHGTACDKCHKTVFSFYSKDCGTGGIKRLCVECHLNRSHKELLETLKLLLERINHNTDPLHTLPDSLYNQYMNKARRAIKKAAVFNNST